MKRRNPRGETSTRVLLILLAEMAFDKSLMSRCTPEVVYWFR